MNGSPSSARSTRSISKPPSSSTRPANHWPTGNPTRPGLVLAMIIISLTGFSGDSRLITSSSSVVLILASGIRHPPATSRRKDTSPLGKMSRAAGRSATLRRNPDDADVSEIGEDERAETGPVVIVEKEGVSGHAGVDDTRPGIDRVDELAIRGGGASLPVDVNGIVGDVDHPDLSIGGSGVLRFGRKRAASRFEIVECRREGLGFRLVGDQVGTAGGVVTGVAARAVIVIMINVEMNRIVPIGFTAIHEIPGIIDMPGIRIRRAIEHRSERMEDLVHEGQLPETSLLAGFGEGEFLAVALQEEGRRVRGRGIRRRRRAAGHAIRFGSFEENGVDHAGSVVSFSARFIFDLVRNFFIRKAFEFLFGPRKF